MKRKHTITYWQFCIDILGPRQERVADRRKMRRVLSRKRLRVIEQTAPLATRAKLPRGFKVIVS